MSSKINVTVPAPGRVLLDIGVGPLTVAVVLDPRAADSLANAMQRAAIEANAPRPVIVAGAAPPANA